MKFIFVQVREVVPVLDTKFHVLRTQQSCFYILIHFLHFEQMRMRLAVGIHQTVTAEVAEARYSFRSVITAIRPIPFAVLVYFTERLVHPVPNITALCHWFVFKNIPIVFQSATTVTHRVQIFTKDEGTVNTLFRYIRFYLIYTTVHTAINIRIVIQFGTFILNRTSLVHRFQPVVCTFKVDTVSGLIAQ